MTKTIQLSCLFLNQTFNPNDHYWKLKSYSLLTGQIPKNESNENITINSIIKVLNSGTTYSEKINIESEFEGSVTFEKVNVGSSSCGSLYTLEILPDFSISISPNEYHICSKNNTGNDTETISNQPTITIDAGSSTSTTSWNLVVPTFSSNSFLNSITTNAISGTGTSSTTKITSIGFKNNTTSITQEITSSFNVNPNTSTTSNCITNSNCTITAATFKVYIHPYVAAKTGTYTQNTICYNNTSFYNLHSSPLFFGNTNTNESSAFFGPDRISLTTPYLNSITGPQLTVEYTYQTATTIGTWGSIVTIGNLTNSNSGPSGCSSGASATNPCAFILPNPSASPTYKYIKINRKVTYKTNGIVRCEDLASSIIEVTTPSNSGTPTVITICNT